MKAFILIFLSSSLINFLIIKSFKQHKKISADRNLSGPQKFHTKITPRVGGISIFLTLPIFGFFIYKYSPSNENQTLLQLWACSIPAFLAGLTEDLTKRVSITTRMLGIIFSAGLGIFFLDIRMPQVGIIGIDWLIEITYISIFFTAISITGLTNAYNIIDGFNGLSSMLAIIAFTAIAYVSFKNNDLTLMLISNLIIGAIGGFFIWNYYRGSIFLGDGGAYLIGYLMATISIILVNRNSNISPWFPFLINAYPISETLFSMWRRKIYQRKNLTAPDGIHLHSLIYRRLVTHNAKKYNGNKQVYSYKTNSKTSKYLWSLSILATIPAVVWHESTPILLCFTLLFLISYFYLYKAIVRFKVPKLLRSTKRKL
jgi:UDP-GlcNAc:undecaprenyl-phosphate GlcNAc-1-phosphate transferase